VETKAHLGDDEWVGRELKDNLPTLNPLEVDYRGDSEEEVGAPSADDGVALDARVLLGDEETLNGLPGVHVVELLLGRGVADECVGSARLVVATLPRLGGGS